MKKRKKKKKTLLGRRKSGLMFGINAKILNKNVESQKGGKVEAGRGQRCRGLGRI